MCHNISNCIAFGFGADKKRDDDIGQLWRVHDKLYDVSEFISKHPGGSEWLELTRGLDITEAFETSHMVNVKRVEEVLNKFYVQDAESPRIAPYTFKEDGFYRTLKRVAEPVLKVRFRFCNQNRNRNSQHYQ
jgi:cytochrome b involved in lipid metabolism